MPYLIYATDFSGKENEREAIREDHRKHLRSVGNKLLSAGALLDDDGKTVIGGISILDTDDRKEAEDFAFNDPYEKAKIRQETLVIKWRKRWWDGQFLDV